eukprot:4359310-Pyramimonas_sp.AAC.1
MDVLDSWGKITVWEFNGLCTCVHFYKVLAHSGIEGNEIPGETIFGHQKTPCNRTSRPSSQKTILYHLKWKGALSNHRNNKGTARCGAVRQCGRRQLVSWFQLAR